MDVTNKNNKTINKKLKKPLTFRDKIKLRHLEIEPLCCMDSCLIRGGCLTIAVFEAIYISITSLLVVYIAYKYQLFNTTVSNSSTLIIYLSIIIFYNLYYAFNNLLH
uniref:Uncharacterized protein n=1 Tax=Strongyloides papillosus TaxID=174720 RepID=A0A0N5C893_STREA